MRSRSSPASSSPSTRETGRRTTFLRGFDAVHGQDLELWVGGIPINEVSNVHGQGYADLHFVMPEVIREVKATPGTYDPKQGDFAVAGIIRIELVIRSPGRR